MKRIIGRKNINTKDMWDGFHGMDCKFNKRLQFYKFICQFIKLETSVIDVGCGVGFGIDCIGKLIPSCALHGADFSDSAIARAKDMYKNIEFFKFDITKDEFDRSWDYITLIEVLEHLEDPVSAIEKCLASCGELIITVPFMRRGDRIKSHIFNEFNDESFAQYNIINTYLFRARKNLFVKLRGNKCLDL